MNGGVGDLAEVLCYCAMGILYHTTDALHGSPCVRFNLRTVAESEFAVFPFFAFLDAAYQGLPYPRTPDFRAYGDSNRGQFQVCDELARGRL